MKTMESEIIVLSESSQTQANTIELFPHTQNLDKYFFKDMKVHTELSWKRKEMGIRRNNEKGNVIKINYMHMKISQ